RVTVSASSLVAWVVGGCWCYRSPAAEPGDTLPVRSLLAVVANDPRELITGQAGAADECSIHIGAGHGRSHIARLHRSPVEDAHVLGDGVPERRSQVGPD